MFLCPFSPVAVTKTALFSLADGGLTWKAPFPLRGQVFAELKNKKRKK